MATQNLTVDEARRLIEEHEALADDLQPHDMSPAAIAEYRARLWHDNPDTTAQEVADTLLAERTRFATARKRFVERQQRDAARHAEETACRCCGEPNQQLVYIGVTERERLQGATHGLVLYLCVPCRPAMVEQFQRRHGDQLYNDVPRRELAARCLDELEV